MSRNDAIDRCAALYQSDISFFKNAGMHRHLAERTVDFLDDYMRIRFGMQPLDKPRDEAVEAVSERNHLAALEARAHLQRIMAGLPGSTPHFHELNELLKKLDAMAGTPVARESDQWTAEDASRIGEADLDAAARNMAPGPDYRPPAELIEHLRTTEVIDEAAENELIEHVLAGRWEIISHVPEQRDHAADFLKEIERARGEVSVQNPAWKALEEAARKITGG